MFSTLAANLPGPEQATEVIDSTACSHDAEARAAQARESNQPLLAALSRAIEHPCTRINVNVDCPRVFSSTNARVLGRVKVWQLRHSV